MQYTATTDYRTHTAPQTPTVTAKTASRVNSNEDKAAPPRCKREPRQAKYGNLHSQAQRALH